MTSSLHIKNVHACRCQFPRQHYLKINNKYVLSWLQLTQLPKAKQTHMGLVQLSLVNSLPIVIAQIVTACWHTRTQQHPI